MKEPKGYENCRRLCLTYGLKSRGSYSEIAKALYTAYLYGKSEKIKIKKKKVVRKSKHKKQYHEYLKSPEWKEIREIVIGIRGGKCEKCKSKSTLQVHHKNYNHIMKEIGHIDDLELLCKKCHRKEHKLK